jgi:hypothetical protein
MANATGNKLEYTAGRIELEEMEYKKSTKNNVNERIGKLLLKTSNHLGLCCNSLNEVIHSGGVCLGKHNYEIGNVRVYLKMLVEKIDLVEQMLALDIRDKKEIKVDDEYTICFCKFKVKSCNLEKHQKESLHYALLEIGNDIILHNAMSFECPLCNEVLNCWEFGWHYKKTHKQLSGCDGV